ncbi:MAG: CapA family protein [Aristaeellaceae bacterium]
MKRTRREPSMHRGVSLGTVCMLAITVAVSGLSAVILPRLLGKADFSMMVDGTLSALTLDDALPVLAMNDIPIGEVHHTPAPSSAPTASARLVTPSPVPTATPVPGGTVTLTIGGSVNIDDAIRKSAYYSESKKYDFTEMMMLLKDEMASDLTLLTLENITLDSDKVSANNAPSAVMDMLADAGVDILALGYPKAYDKGQAGLAATVEAARERGMTTIGAYLTENEANTLCMVTVDHVQVAFLHYTETISTTGQKAISADGQSYALPTMYVNGAAAAMLSDVRKAREAGADVIIVSLNWGTVSASKPTAAQKEVAQQLAEAGADVIVGAGSRVVQPITWLTSRQEDGSIRHTLCAWSLGSLLNESRKDGNVLGMLLQLQISFDGDSLSFEKVCYTPTYIWRYKQDGQYYYRIAVSDQPAPDGMSDEQAGYMEKALRNLKKNLGDSPVTLRTK